MILNTSYGKPLSLFGIAAGPSLLIALANREDSFFIATAQRAQRGRNG
jgi:hypothetical protein